WLALAFAVQPRLAAPDEMEDRPRRSCGVERPVTGVTTLLEDAPAQSQRVQGIRQEVDCRRFGYEIRRFCTSPAGLCRSNLRPTRGTARAGPGATGETRHD